MNQVLDHTLCELHKRYTYQQLAQFLSAPMDSIPQDAQHIKAWPIASVVMAMCELSFVDGYNACLYSVQNEEDEKVPQSLAEKMLRTESDLTNRQAKDRIAKSIREIATLEQ